MALMNLSTFKALAGTFVTVLLLSVGQAKADFRGGGALFGFTEACTQHGWRVAGTYSIRVRHAASEDNAGGAPPSQVTLAFPAGTEHFSVWGPLTPSTVFNGAAGRQTWTFFTFYNNRPLIRTVSRIVTERVNPAGPATVHNARELLLRLRVQNFNNLAGCSATVVATLRRVN
jgi:hypothetical protein